MKELKEAIGTLVAEELERANESKGPFVDYNHAYGVLLEEVDEVKEEIRAVVHETAMLWNHSKDNDSCRVAESAELLKLHAIALACEAIQVAAMCEKTLMMQDQQTEDKSTSPISQPLIKTTFELTLETLDQEIEAFEMHQNDGNKIEGLMVSWYEHNSIHEAVLKESEFRFGPIIQGGERDKTFKADEELELIKFVEMIRFSPTTAKEEPIQVFVESEGCYELILMLK